MALSRPGHDPGALPEIDLTRSDSFDKSLTPLHNRADRQPASGKVFQETFDGAPMNRRVDVFGRPATSPHAAGLARRIGPIRPAAAASGNRVGPPRPATDIR
jgi:hypothetical protein